MEEKKHRLVIDGNAFYELDLECQKRYRTQDAPYEKKDILKYQRDNNNKRQRR